MNYISEEINTNSLKAAELDTSALTIDSLTAQTLNCTQLAAQQATVGDSHSTAFTLYATQPPAVQNMSASSATIQQATVGALTANSADITVSAAAGTSATIGSVNCLTATIGDAVVTTATAGAATIPSVTVPTINITQTNTLSSVLADTISSTNANATTASVSSLTANNVSATSQTGTNMTVNGNFTVTTSDQPAVYSSPNEGVFRGISFFQNVDVGIGSTNPLVSMNMYASGDNAYLNGYNTFLGKIDGGTDFDSSLALLSLSTPGRTTLRFQANGNLAIYQGATKVWQNGTAVSDARLKENVVPLARAMEKILQIDGVTFNYNFGARERSCGVILEQVARVFPECVEENLVHLELLVPLLVAGIKELKERDSWIRAHQGAAVLD